MRITTVDESATRGSSMLHRASPKAKLAALGLLLGAVVVNQNVLVVASVGLALAAMVLALRLPARHVFAFALYPALFAVVFAFASAPDVLTGGLFVAKAVTAALGAVMLVFTTPYPQVFAPLQRVLPGIVGDAMLMTYRSLFLLASKLGSLITAVRLRSGLSSGHPLRAGRATAQALGGLLLYSFDLSQRDYDVMRLRGYEERLHAYLPPSTSRARDAVVVAVAGLLFGVALAWRLWWAVLNPYSLLPAAAALAALVLAASWSTWRT